MSSFSVCWLLFLLLLPILTLYPSCWASSNSITLSLTTQYHYHHSENSSPLSVVAYASIQRARHLKRSTSATTLVYPVSIGCHITTLGFGTPAQPLDFILDTGSGLVWFPCGPNYNCTACNNVTNIPTFNPKLSSSSKNASCISPQLKRIDPHFRPCTSCWQHPTHNCSKKYIHYEYGYGEGSTRGQLMLESLTLSAAGNNINVPNLLVGCSNSSDNVSLYGIAGFGRSRMSLPAQLGLKSFSYCLVSHKYDDNKRIHSPLVLNWGDGRHVNVMNHTPFANTTNISTFPQFQEFYYVSLLEIHVGCVKVNVSSTDLVANADGSGGTFVDSGTTLTVMEKSVFDPIAHELDKQLLGKRYTRSKEEEAATGLGLCYSVPCKANISDLPALTFVFAGSVQMVMPFENSFIYNTTSAAICSTMISYGDLGIPYDGPAIILGNYMQQNFQMEFDLHNNQLGFYHTDCTHGISYSLACDHESNSHFSIVSFDFATEEFSLSPWRHVNDERFWPNGFCLIEYEGLLEFMYWPPFDLCREALDRDV
ncbi:eukaryotic aspartyl protease family protein [Striga asiatica]|uniref:Eukaryotic aspartyl protease family protein n=1 Tax=Striga asiatica TaxID=4170 RepID=A0A5A7QL67_STRAF|nr:eukaryotic aspartyl protease family protein [Striga asiatica]